MIRPNYHELNFPKGLNLDILSEYLSDTQMEDLIIQCRDLPRKERRIILPSKACTRKVFFHYVWRQVLAGQADWKKIRKGFKEFGSTLADVKASKCDVRNCYIQREREMIKELK